ncbi:Retrovirus-related Pol polyprotein from type-2 retrotransposable element R2DM [Sesamum angolense]|uniref:Retrovirus-related Pol polyprotein from type-2 retrotransposable element R2DM n=1 Tax=Sesamum angolense TaxID=2727404 RepID=A0AAE1W1E8_9LAMI|nr:Retrovirus-related Pol polyprotein from type-2 retrotransposable element R2DM [Sesamum angolense]
MAARRSKRQQTHGLGTIAPQPTRLEAPTAELGILHKAAARLEPPTMGVGSKVPDLQGAATCLDQPTFGLGKDECILQGTAAPLEPPKVDAGTKKSLAATASLTPRSAPTLGMAADPSNGDLSLACPLTAALPSTCPLSNIALPAAAALNGSAPLNLVASSPRPRVAPRVPLMSPPFAMDVVGMGGFLSPPRRPSFRLHLKPEAHLDLGCATTATLGPSCSSFAATDFVAPIATDAVDRVSTGDISTGYFIGNVPLKPCSDPFVSDDKIAAAFHNSSRKTLTYIPPSVQNGEILVRPSIDMIREGSNRWNTTAVGYFLVAAMEEVLEGGPWLYLGQPIVLQKWKPGMVLRKLKHTEVPVWIKLRHLPVELWTTDGLSTVASGIGRPLFPDAITRTCTRLDFARVDVEYEWLPPKCTNCTSLGHATKECPLTKPVKPPVSIYVRKNQTPAPALRTGDPIRIQIRFLNIPGLKTTWKDHQVTVRDLVSEFRLHFTALLETRVMPSNVCRVQTGLLPRWRWFVDYSGPGNRIWIAWNDDFIDVDILNIGSQFVHCRVHMHDIHEHILITVVYGANEVSARRELWQGLTELAVSADLPWLVGGDFNAVLDMSEVSGASGDIRVAMHEFNDCIIQTGLISLPMQGERFSWHNCSTDGRSLWKRLDRMFVNDAWLEQWPNLFYTCLTPRTSDHSPLVLKGDSRMYRLVYLKATQLEHVMLRQRAKLQWLKGGDQCSKAFFRRVATRRANKRLFQISDSDGLVQTNPTTISSVFVTYFQDLLAMFDIEEDKAPGPDGFSSGFYKAAWPIVGKEISKAIMDFFTTGRLLKQVNATLLTLIPKCRLPPRCALKVDLRKAYDTVEWDFLFATLRLFGFPAVFIRWIEECVTSAHYSVVVNGGVHGFFAGARGLRQGDPMSPYLFVLVMEVLQMILQQFIDQDGQFLYHWRCTELKLFQLSFADDLLLLCKADVRSAASGLRDSLLETLGFQEGHLPVRYLGLPLISARLSIADCQPLLQKIDSRIKGWEGVQLSFAGRVQLIKSVLVSLEVYWAMAFILPKGIINEMIKRLRTFLWKGTSSSGYPKVAWEVVCRPREEGGQGIKDIFALNRALMSKHLWAVIKQDRTSIWVDWIFQVRLRDCSIWTVKENKGGWGWRKMLTLRHTLLSHIHFRVGDGTSFLLWHDPWHPLGPLITRFPGDLR